jgi:hypothetical protein
MARTPIPREIESEVILLSRRRCCICFGLNRDLQLKQGQIAHLDRNSSNGNRENLAYLCLAHHDQYDSRTSQSKGLTESEVKQYRKELHETVAAALAATVKLGDTESEAPGVAGRYVRDGSDEFASAELQVSLSVGGAIKVDGIALAGRDRMGGTHVGVLDFEVPFPDGRRAFHEDRRNNGYYKLQLTFEKGLALAEEYDSGGHFGLGVRFAGMYRKVADIKQPPASDSSVIASSSADANAPKSRGPANEAKKNEASPPNVGALPPRIVQMTYDEELDVWNRRNIPMSDGDPKLITGVVIPFCNEPQRNIKTRGVSGLGARVIIYKRDDIREFKRLDWGCWLGEAFRTVDLRAGETSYLIGAILVQGRGFVVENRRHWPSRYSADPTSVEDLSKGEYEIKIVLIGGENAEYFEEFWFDLEIGDQLHMRRASGRK